MHLSILLVLVIKACFSLPLWFGIVEDYIKNLEEFLDFFSTHSLEELDLLEEITD